MTGDDKEWQRHQKYGRLGDYLRKQRLKVGMSQSVAAKHLNLSDRQFVSRLERSVAPLPLYKIPILAELYQTDVNELIEAVIAEQEFLTRQKIQNIMQPRQKDAEDPHAPNQSA